MTAAAAGPVDQAEKAACCLSYVNAVSKLLKHLLVMGSQHWQPHKRRGLFTLTLYEELQQES